MSGKRGVFRLLLLLTIIMMEGEKTEGRKRYVKVDNKGLIFLTPNLVKANSTSRKACACFNWNGNCVAFHWLPSDGTCQLVPNDNTAMNVTAGGGLELYQPDDIAKGANNSCNGLRFRKACVFPFTYNSKTYNGCTTADFNKFWCSTTGNYTIGSNSWEICPFSCPIVNPCC